MGEKSMLMRVLPIFVTPTLKNVGESFIDHVFRGKVLPELGSVVYCDLAFGYIEHSGIYVGNDEIVHLNRHGRIEKVSAEQFISRTTAMSIYVSSANGEAVGSREVCHRALSIVGQTRHYHVLRDNCHQFTSGCLTGNFENRSRLLTLLKMQSKKALQADEWRVWER